MHIIEKLLLEGMRSLQNKYTYLHKLLMHSVKRQVESTIRRKRQRPSTQQNMELKVRAILNTLGET